MRIAKNRLRRAELNIAMFQVVLRNESNQSSQCFFRAFVCSPLGTQQNIAQIQITKQFFVTFNAEYEIIKNITM